MRLVVTGALGHIGSRLIRTLPRTFPDVEVVLVDNLATQRYASLFHLDPGNYRFVEADLLRAELAPLFDGAAYVVHLAARTDPSASVFDPEVERFNFSCTLRVAEACLATGSAMFQVSSTSVYGSAGGKIDEDSPHALRPQSPYAESKLREEQLLHELGAGKGLRFAVCRFGTICGVSPGMRFHTAVNRFCWQAANARPLTVWKTALHQKRPYLDLGEAIEAIHFFLRERLFQGETYNVLTDNLTVHSVIELIRQHAPELTVALVDSPIMNELSYEISDAKLRARGFAYRGSIAQCIAETMQLLNGLRLAGVPSGQ